MDFASSSSTCYRPAIYFLLAYLVPVYLIFPAQASQPSAPSPLAAPLRDLQWGQLNFLHTTDTHGWLAGHLSEPSYSADWGDYVSFSAHMREKAESSGGELLVIETGDRVEGNGLYDASEPKGIYITDILRQQHIDLMSTGNHELYKRSTSERELLTIVPEFNNSYLASNTDIRDPVTGELVPLARRFMKFITPKQGIRILAFGFLFDFTGNSNNTVVRPVEDAIKEDWFQEAINERDIDLFLVIGHVPVRSKEFDSIFREIRARRNTPIQFFGGHHHIRDYVKYDSKAYGLASGRFMETIGFMSISNLSTGSPTFHRRYIDNNLFSFRHHTNMSEEEFPTQHGLNVSRLIQKYRSDLQLDTVYGCAPNDLWMFRTRYPSEDNIYTWLGRHVINDTLTDRSRSGIPALSIVNSGAIRFDILKGPFTQDTAFTVSPFTSGFRYVKDVPYDKALLTVDILNKQPQILTQAYLARYPTSAPDSSDYYAANMVADNTTPSYYLQMQLSGSRNPPGIFPGYTTIDDGGADGDDTIHSRIPIYQAPNCISTLVSNSSIAPEMVDLVYIDFIEPHVALAGKMARLDVDFSKDSNVYMPSVTLTSLIRQWVKDNWSCGYE